MSKNFCEMSCEILRATQDGDTLDPVDLKLVELAVNGWLNECGEVVFMDLHRRATAGEYVKPWLFGIQHLTRNHEGYVFWKWQEVEHYTFGIDGTTERLKADAVELARRCLILEEQGIPVNTFNAVWNWQEREGS